ncbi:MAG: ABC transporter substrate binding protein [Pseudomonadota bacterium]
MMGVFRYLVVVCVLLVSGAPPRAAAAAETILVIESYHAEFPWDAGYKEALQATLGKKYQLEFFQMDTKRLPKAQHAAMADKAWRRFQALRPALVVLGDDAALKLLAQRLGTTSVPVVYLGINNNPRKYFDASVIKNITGVLERPALKRNIVFVSEILPKARRALVLFDTDVTSQVVLNETFDGKHRQSINGVSVELKLVERWEQWQTAVLNAKENYDVVFIGLYQALHDASGKSVNTSDEVVRWTSDKAPVPVFCFWDFSVGADKAIGGLVLYGKEQGRAAADLALKILSGTAPETIYPVTADRGHFLFSRKQLRRFHITLPAEIAAEANYTD